MRYIIHPVPLGSYMIDGSKLEYLELSSFGKPVHKTHGFFLLEDEEGAYIMVDSGCPSYAVCQEEHLPYPVSEDVIPVTEALQKQDVQPEDIRAIILTHLHWDHAWNLDQFPGAVIYVQRTEAAHAVTPYEAEKQDYCMTKETFLKGWTKGILRMKAVEGDAHLFPGIDVLMTPGHTEGSQSVKVHGYEKDYLLTGDWTYDISTLDKAKAPADLMDFHAWYRSYDRIMGSEAVVLCAHDDCVYKKAFYR